jgi:hypothetical protein
MPARNSNYTGNALLTHSRSGKDTAVKIKHVHVAKKPDRDDKEALEEAVEGEEEEEVGGEQWENDGYDNEVAYYDDGTTYNESSEGNYYDNGTLYEAEEGDGYLYEEGYEEGYDEA